MQKTRRGETSTHADVQQTMGQSQPFGVNPSLRESKADWTPNHVSEVETLRLDFVPSINVHRANAALIRGAQLEQVRFWCAFVNCQRLTLRILLNLYPVQVTKHSEE